MALSVSNTSFGGSCLLDDQYLILESPEVHDPEIFKRDAAVDNSMNFLGILFPIEPVMEKIERIGRVDRSIDEVFKKGQGSGLGGNAPFPFRQDPLDLAG